MMSDISALIKTEVQRKLSLSRFGSFLIIVANSMSNVQVNFMVVRFLQFSAMALNSWFRSSSSVNLAMINVWRFFHLLKDDANELRF